MWDGVRSYQARNNLRAMRRGDLVLFYHSVTGKEVVGVASVDREAYPDPTDSTGTWSVVDLIPLRPLAHPVSLARIKATPSLASIALVRQGRLSVMPLSREEFGCLCDLAENIGK